MQRQNWSKVTLSQYLELLSMQSENYDNSIDYQVDCVSLLLDLPIDEVEEMSVEELTDVMESFSFMRSLPTSVQSVGDLSMIDLIMITLGQFIDCEHYITDTSTYHNVLAVLYRKKSTNEWDHIIVEPYGYDIAERGRVMLNSPMSSVWGALQKYLSFRDKIYQDYEPLFNSNDDDDDEVETQEQKKELLREKQLAKYSWDKFIYDLCKEDLTKFDHVTDLPLILVLNMMSMAKVNQYR